MSFYSVGLSALRNAQVGLTVAGHNITNANTPGYHRQSFIQSTNVPLYFGSGFIGQGAHVDTVRRAINQTLETQLLQVQAQGAQLDSYLGQLSPLDNALGSAEDGLSAAFDNFFTAISALSASPSSIPARQTVLSNSQALVAQFQSLGQRFDEVREGLDSQLEDSVSEINTLAAQVANLNRQIALQTGVGNEFQPPNDLLDQREELISRLNKEVGTTTIIQDDGSATVFFGSGQPLVIQDQVFTLTAANGLEDPQHLDVSYQYGTTTIPIGSNNISGGRLGGLLAFRDEILDEAQNSLGLVALGLAKAFNDQHRLGQDLAGAAGGDFFDIPTTTIQPHTSNVGAAVLSASLANVQDVTTSDYRLVKDTVGPDYTLVKLTDNSTTAILAADIESPASITIDGVTLQISAAATAGDSYLIRPTRNIATNITLSAGINTSTIAAAAPIRTSATLGNLGTGKISAGEVNSPNNKVTITFTAAATYDVVDSSTGATLASGVAYASPATLSYNGWTAEISGAAVAGDTFTVTNGATKKTASGAGSLAVIGDATVDVTPLNPNLTDTIRFTYNSATNQFDVFDVTNAVALPSQPVAGTYNSATGLAVSINGWTVKLTGVPENGDQFVVSPNINGISDNRNALLLAQLQSRNTLKEGAVSFEGTFAQAVSLVGNKTSEIKVTSEAQAKLIEQTETAQQSVSGVNLDEEAADLLRFQQAYQAAGKMMEISTIMFDTLLSIGR